MNEIKVTGKVVSIKRELVTPFLYSEKLARYNIFMCSIQGYKYAKEASIWYFDNEKSDIKITEGTEIEVEGSYRLCLNEETKCAFLDIAANKIKINE